MSRRVFPILAALSALLLALIIAEYLHTFSQSDLLVHQSVDTSRNTYSLETLRFEHGRLNFLWQRYKPWNPPILTPLPGWSYHRFVTRRGGIAWFRHPTWRFSSPRWVNQRTLRIDSFDVDIPCWLLACIAAILPVWWLILRRTRAPAAGHCPRCGYDLRATPAQCPECGLTAAAGASSIPSPKVFGVFGMLSLALAGLYLLWAAWLYLPGFPSARFQTTTAIGWFSSQTMWLPAALAAAVGILGLLKRRDKRWPALTAIVATAILYLLFPPP